MGERVSSRERARRWCQMQEPGVTPQSPLYEQLLESIMAQGASYCDLCYGEVLPGSAVWTCSNGNRTILHANAFDVCDSCFVRFASPVISDADMQGQALGMVEAAT